MFSLVLYDAIRVTRVLARMFHLCAVVPVYGAMLLDFFPSHVSYSTRLTPRTAFQEMSWSKVRGREGKGSGRPLTDL
jgi:hypothetical protein